MNYRNRALLDLAYQCYCNANIPGVCDGGIGEPAHANESLWGKGMGIKSHDFAFAAMCRPCHQAIDQGSHLTKEQRQNFWWRAHVETMRELWARGLLCVTPNGSALRILCNNEAPAPAKPRKGSKRGTHTKTPDKCRIGWTKGEAA